MLTVEIDRTMDELSDRIRRARRITGLSLAEFGKRCGLAAATIQKIENRTMAPTIPVAMKIAHGLGIHVGELLSPSDEVNEDLVVQQSGNHARLPGDPDLLCFRLFSHHSGQCAGIVADGGRAIFEISYARPSAHI